MRKLILPCLLFLLLSLSKESFSQTCASPYILNMDGTCTSAFDNTFAIPVPGTGTAFQRVSGAVGSGGCGYANTNGRVTWFRFTPTTDLLTADFEIWLDEDANTEVAFYDQTGTGCPTLGSFQADAVGCFNNGATQAYIYQPSSTRILRAGRTYFLRIYTNITHSNPRNIYICPKPVPIHTIPLNNLPNDYAVRPLGTGRNYSSVGGTAPQRCNYAANRRVTWFKFTPTTSTNCATFNITTGGAAGTDAEVSFYDPTQANPLIANSTLCMPDGYGVFAPKATSGNGPYALTANNTYYLRIYTDINNNNPVNINIQARTVNPPNDFCNTAKQLDVNGISDENNVCMTGETSNAEPNYIATNSDGLICTPTMHNTAWYYVEVANTTQPVNIQVTSVHCVNANNTTTAIQIGTLIWDGGSCLSTGNLTKPTGTSCYQGPLTSPPPISVSAGQIPVGGRLYITIDGYEGSNCSYTINPSNAIPIPVKMEYFTAWKQNGKNQLKWATSTELNNAYFEVERSTDGKNFTAIGRVEGAGNSSTTNLYQFDDFNYPLMAWYRLRQVDFDAQSDYSNVVMIKRENEGAGLGASFANPVLNNNRISITTRRAGMVSMRVVDISGKSLDIQQVECTPGNTYVMKDFSRLAAGSYYLVLMQGDEKIVKPFIKQ